jgi:sulfur-oxidizing protein SoxX
VLKPLGRLEDFPAFQRNIGYGMRRITLILSFSLLFVLSACGGGGDGPVVGDAANGKKLYNQATIGTKSAEGCVSCHNYDEAEGPEENAPYTAGTGTRAATRVPGMSAEEYIHESILTPNAYVVEGFQEGDMYQTFGEELSEQQIADLVAYLLTEK